jgi:hypothetical protein
MRAYIDPFICTQRPWFIFRTSSWPPIWKERQVYTQLFKIKTTELTGNSPFLKGKLTFEIKTNAQPPDECSILVKILDKTGKLVGESWERQGLISIENANAWWPIYMHENPGYLYTMKVNEQYILTIFRLKL